MVTDYRLAALGVLILVVALLSVACAVSRTAREAVGSATPEAGLATRVAAAQARADATRDAAATSAAATDAAAPRPATATVASTPAAAATAMPTTTATARPVSATTSSPGPVNSPQSVATPANQTATYSADFRTWDSGEKGAPDPAHLTFDQATNAYRITLMDPSRFYAYLVYAPEGRAFTDFHLSVDMRRASGPELGSYGVLLRTQQRGPNDKTNARYNVLVRPDDQHFSVNAVNADGSAKVIGSGTAQEIKKGDGVNHLEVIAVGDKVSVSVNGQRLGSYAGATMASGAVGLMTLNPARPSGSAPLGVAFSDLRIAPPPSN